MSAANRVGNMEPGSVKEVYSVVSYSKGRGGKSKKKTRTRSENMVEGASGYFFSELLVGINPWLGGKLRGSCMHTRFSRVHTAVAVALTSLDVLVLWTTDSN